MTMLDDDRLSSLFAQAGAAFAVPATGAEEIVARATGRPVPTCRRIWGSSQLTNFGDTTPAFDRKDSSTSWWTASGSSATSS